MRRRGILSPVRQCPPRGPVGFSVAATRTSPERTAVSHLSRQPVPLATPPCYDALMSQGPSLTAHIIRIDISETAAGPTLRYLDDRLVEEPRLLKGSVIEAIEGKVRELSEAESTWDSGTDLRAIRLDLGTHLFALLDGPGRRLVRALGDARTANLPPHLVLRFSANEAGAPSPPRGLRWRWETLQGSDSGPLFGIESPNAPRLTLQLGPAEFGDATALPTRCLRVLFMASSSLATEPILDFEMEEERLLTAVAPLRRLQGRAHGREHDRHRHPRRYG